MMGEPIAPAAGGTEVYADMEQWTEIRRRVLVKGMSKREACKRYAIHFLTLRKILTPEEPPGYRRAKSPARPLTAPVLPVIRQILDDDATAPRKQRHTAKRIWERLKAEHDFKGGYTSVKDAVRELKVGRKEVFLPLSHPPGEAQVDFGFAKVIVAGVETDVAVFVMSLPYSDAVYCQVFPRECTETFQEGHARAFAFRGGVPAKIAYDNTKAAVAKVVGPRERELTRELLRLKSYYLFESHFCLVRRPNEKGHVERLVEYARSNFLVPVPTASNRVSSRRYSAFDSALLNRPRVTSLREPSATGIVTIASPDCL
jgi:transposase